MKVRQVIANVAFSLGLMIFAQHIPAALADSVIFPADVCSAPGIPCLLADAAGCAESCPGGCRVQGASCWVFDDAQCICLGGGGEPVPEPSTIFLLIPVLLGLFYWNRQLRK